MEFLYFKHGILYYFLYLIFRLLWTLQSTPSLILFIRGHLHLYIGFIQYWDFIIYDCNSSCILTYTIIYSQAHTILSYASNFIQMHTGVVWFIRCHTKECCSPRSIKNVSFKAISKLCFTFEKWCECGLQRDTLWSKAWFLTYFNLFWPILTFFEKLCLESKNMPNL